MVKYYIIIGIIYTIPYIVTIVISGLRKKLETDRNFYGKTIDIQKIELTNVSYKKFEIARNNIKKYTEMGEIKYVYDRSYDFEDERLLLSEKEYASYIGTKHCIGVANGLDALRLILKAYIEMGIMAEGDEVIVPVPCWMSYIEMIKLTSGIAVLVNMDEKSGFDLDVDKISSHVTEKTKAVLINSVKTSFIYSRESSLSPTAPSINLIYLMYCEYVFFIFVYSFCLQRQLYYLLLK